MQNACRAWAALVVGLRGKERFNYCSKFDLACWFGRRKMRKNIVGIVLPSHWRPLSRWARFMCGWSNKIIASDFLCKYLFAPWLSHVQNKSSICIYAWTKLFLRSSGPDSFFYGPAFRFYGARCLRLIRWRDLSVIRELFEEGQPWGLTLVSTLKN